MSGRKVLREKVNGLLVPEDEVTALCNVYLAAASYDQSIAYGSSFKKVKGFSAASVNVGVDVDYVNGEIELLQDGVYEISYDIAVAASAVVTDFRALAQSDGVSIRQSTSRISYISGVAGEAASMHGSAVYSGTTGQKISLGVSHGVGTPITMTFYNLSITIRKIGG